jgi:hypothetical protein
VRTGDKKMSTLWRRRNGKGGGEEGKDPSSPKNHTDGGGEPHKEVVCSLHTEKGKLLSLK